MKHRLARWQRSALVATTLFAVTPFAGAEEERITCVNAFDQAQRLRPEGRLLDARAALRTCAAEACPSSTARLCLMWLTEVENSVPSVIVSARTLQGTDVVNARIWIDGALVQSRAGMPIELDPGLHRIAGQSPVGRVVGEDVVINAGERNRLVRLTFDVDEAPPDRPPSPQRTSLVVPAALGIASALLMGTGGVLAIGANVDVNTLRNTCGATRSCAASDVDGARTRMGVGDVLFGAGVVSLAVAAWLLLH